MAQLNPTDTLVRLLLTYDQILAGYEAVQDGLCALSEIMAPHLLEKDRAQFHLSFESNSKIMESLKKGRDHVVIQITEINA